MCLGWSDGGSLLVIEPSFFAIDLMGVGRGYSDNRG